MKGYFKSLAKQSGVTVGAGHLSARPPTTPLIEVVKPLHSEVVNFVEPATTTEAPGELTEVFRRVPEPPAAHRLTNDLTAHNEINRSPPQTGGPTPAAAAPMVIENNLDVTADPTAAFAQEEAAHSPFTQWSEEIEPSAIALPHTTAGKRDSGKGGVVRVGAFDIATESPPSLELESVNDLTQAISRVAPATPAEYLEGIREWLASPPVESERETNVVPHHVLPEVFAASDSRDQPPLERVADRASSPQNEIQEFSLSIGSISIVVEEPQAKQQTNIVPPPPNAAVNSPPRARDAFALTRRYFRGL